MRRRADQNVPRQTFVLGKGEVNSADRRLIKSFLGHFGMEVTMMSEDEYRRFLDRQRPVVAAEAGKGEPPAFSFRAIASPRDYLVKEHFEDFRRSVRPDFRKALVSRLFNHLVDGSYPKEGYSGNYVQTDPGGNRHYRAPQPAPGISVKLRSQLGISPYDGPVTDNYGPGPFTVRFAIEAGGLIDRGLAINAEPELSARETILAAMACELNSQVERASQP